MRPIVLPLLLSACAAPQASVRDAAPAARASGAAPYPAHAVVVPAGTVRLGSPETEPGHDEDESPQLELQVPLFAIDRHEVTAAAFAHRRAEVVALVGALHLRTEAETPQTWIGKCNLGSGREDHPVNCVTAAAARTYCRLLGGDLPTEAEWERAARADPAAAAYPWGEAFDPERAVSSVPCGTRGCAGGTAPAVTSGPRCNALGVCDLAGNLWEWTVSGYTERLGATAAEVPDELPADPVHRGGSWANHRPELFRAAMRGVAYPQNGLTGVGFRCVYRVGR